MEPYLRFLSILENHLNDTSDEVKSSFLKFYTKISDKIRHYFLPEFMYISSLGTCNIEFDVIEFDAIFSIEIGSKFVGYFCEENSKTSSFIDKVDISDIQEYDKFIHEIDEKLYDFMHKYVITKTEINKIKK